MNSVSSVETAVPVPMRVLVVDSQTESREQTVERFGQAPDSYSLTTVTDPTEVVELLARREYHCVVSAFQLPTMDGLELLHAVREDNPDLPFVLYTANGSEQLASDAIAAGVTAYLIKDSDHEQGLIDRIKRAVAEAHSLEDLRDRARRLETLVDTLPGIVYRCRNEPNWPMEIVEGEAAEICGYTAEELASGAVSWGGDILHPDERDWLWEDVQKGLSMDGTFEVTYRIVTNDGQTKWMWERGRGVYEDDETLVALEGFITDITARKEYEQELRELSQFRQTIIESANIWINVLDEEGNVVVWNEAAAEISGYSSDEVIGTDDIWAWLYPDPDYRQDILERVNAILEREDEVKDFETTIQTKDGDERIISWYSDAMTDETGEVLGSVAIGRDVTARHRREEQLEETTRQLDGVLDSVEAAIWMRDTNHRFLLVNQTYRDLFGLSDETTVVGTQPSELLPADLAAQLCANDAKVMESAEPLEIEEEIRTDDGHRTYLTRITPLVDESGAVYATCGISSEITKQKQHEQRLAVLNRVLRHNLRNSITAMQGYAHVLAERSNEADRQLAERIIDQATSLASTAEKARDIDRLLALETDAEQVQLGSMIQYVVDEIQANAHDAEITIDLETDPVLHLQSDLLYEILHHVLENALEHTETDPVISIQTTPLADGRVELSIRDNGPGIPELERTAVDDGEEGPLLHGSGLGLWLVKWATTTVGGELDILRTDAGTDVRITLPVFENEA